MTTIGLMGTGDMGAAVGRALGGHGHRVLTSLAGRSERSRTLAAAAGIATLDLYQEEGLFERAAELEGYWEDGLHSLKDHPAVIDIRNLGLMGGIEFEPRPGKPAHRGYDIFTRCYEKGVLVRYSADILAMSPPLIVSRQQIDQIVDTLGDSIKEAA